MKKINLFKKKLLLFFLLFFSIFSTFSPASFSKRSGSFFFDQEKVIEEEIDSEIWPLSNNLIILSFFLIIIFIVYTLCTIFPISKEDKFLFTNNPSRRKKINCQQDLQIIKNINATFNNKGEIDINGSKLNLTDEEGKEEEIDSLENLNNSDNNINDENTDNKSKINIKASKLNFIFDVNNKFESKFNKDDKTFETVEEVEEGIDAEKKKLAKIFNLQPETDLKLIDAIINSYSSENDFENYGESNLVLNFNFDGQPEEVNNAASIINHDFSNKKYYLLTDIFGFGETNKPGKIKDFVKDKTEILRNKFKFFAGIMFLTKKEIEKQKINVDRVNSRIFSGKCMQIFYSILIKIAEKLTYISPGDNNKTKKAKRNEGLKKFVDFFLVILCHQYQDILERKKIKEHDIEKISLSFPSIHRYKGKKVVGMYLKNIKSEVKMIDIFEQYENLMGS